MHCAMLRRRVVNTVAAVCLAATSTVSVAAQTKPQDPMAALQAKVSAADRALQENERQIAESRYRDALYDGWMIAAALGVGDARLTDARDAFDRAAQVVVDNRDALESLAIVDLQLRDPAAAIGILTRLVAANPKGQALRRLFAQALVMNRQPEEAVQALEEGHAADPTDAETTFALASGYLQTKHVDAADKLFAEVAAARPIPQTYLLIGRAYRDFAQYARARTAIRKALALDPKVPHAHFYLGTIEVMEEGVVRVDAAMAEFRRELQIDPNDPLVNLRLGMALVEAHREKEALAPLQLAARDPSAGWQAFQYLGRCQLALGQAGNAVQSLRKAVQLSESLPVHLRIGNLHYQLGQALRQSGDEQGAAAEFAAANAEAAERTESGRDALQRFMKDEADAPGSNPAMMLPLDPGGFAKLSPAARQALAQRTKQVLASVYLNLGVMQAQGERFARAAGFFEEAAAVDPAFPRVEYSLGVAYFNAKQYAKSIAPLTRAVADDAQNGDARRMLALAALNTEDYGRAAELLRGDPGRPGDTSLQFAYGVALVRSGNAAEAERIFSEMLAQHADSPELNVLIGQAHAEQKDYDGAIASLQRALQLKPDVAEANATLGQIYLRQGKLGEAADALRAELKSHPEDVKARFTLATVLDLDSQSDKAVTELKGVLQARPEYADARYLYGKILLAGGSAADAVEQLEIAERLAPEDANVHYQLGQAYQKLGRTEQAQQQFADFQKLKDRKRGGTQ
jgi:tetratricopeptide (TPR) repeat protein